MRRPAFFASLARLFGIELMCGAFLMRCLSAFAGDFALLAFIHGSKPALAGLAAPIAFSFIRLHMCLLKANLEFSGSQPVQYADTGSLSPPLKAENTCILINRPSLLCTRTHIKDKKMACMRRGLNRYVRTIPQIEPGFNAQFDTRDVFTILKNASACSPLCSRENYTMMHNQVLVFIAWSVLALLVVWSAVRALIIHFFL
jgi:hypothetical protein